MKFFIRQTARNIVRHRKKSILHILIGVMTVLILDVYAGNMDSTEKQLTDLPNVLEVTARISTLNGSQREGMTIREDRMMGVRESEYVKDPVFTVRLKFGFGAFTVEEYKENLNYYGMGMNVPEGVSGMKREEITWLDGVDADILETAEKVCILDAALMEEKGLRPGDDVMLTIFYYRYASEGSEVLSSRWSRIHTGLWEVCRSGTFGGTGCRRRSFSPWTICVRLTTVRALIFMRTPALLW